MLGPVAGLRLQARHLLDVADIVGAGRAAKAGIDVTAGGLGVKRKVAVGRVFHEGSGDDGAGPLPDANDKVAIAIVGEVPVDRPSPAITGGVGGCRPSSREGYGSPGGAAVTPDFVLVF